MSHTPSSRAVTGSPIPTVTYGSGGSFTISCSSLIAATPTECLDVVVAASEYPTWNRFCRKCTIHFQPAGSSSSDNLDKLQLGTQFTFDVHLNQDDPDGSSGRSTALEVSVLEPIDEEDAGDSGLRPSPPSPATGTSRRKGWRIAWKQRHSLLMPASMLRSERVQEFVEVVAADGGWPETQYTCWETFYGVLAPVVRLAVGRQVEQGFDAWLSGLKEKVEKTGKVSA
ncbi:hypothetical protein C7999DRAFT_38082 [Corynascus novoguineensis]|uniref:Coenzyme Q-binding protein COQ10 START domain-containing protein n=1 Tax=Corynascus novoguineensis TaxID=1126955 RepID=A0AAN7CYW8_9PEZI|nr:hypothetical protein C7999DRAFT_38082 [Corynascus novoguineensis]